MESRRGKGGADDGGADEKPLILDSAVDLFWFPSPSASEMTGRVRLACRSAVVVVVVVMMMMVVLVVRCGLFRSVSPFRLARRQLLPARGRDRGACLWGIGEASIVLCLLVFAPTWECYCGLWGRVM